MRKSEKITRTRSKICGENEKRDEKKHVEASLSL